MNQTLLANLDCYIKVTHIHTGHHSYGHLRRLDQQRLVLERRDGVLLPLQDQEQFRFSLVTLQDCFADQDLPRVRAPSVAGTAKQEKFRAPRSLSVSELKRWCHPESFLSSNNDWNSKVSKGLVLFFLDPSTGYPVFVIEKPLKIDTLQRRINYIVAKYWKEGPKYGAAVGQDELKDYYFLGPIPYPELQGTRHQFPQGSQEHSPVPQDPPVFNPPPFPPEPQEMQRQPSQGSQVPSVSLVFNAPPFPAELQETQHRPAQGLRGPQVPSPEYSHGGVYSTFGASFTSALLPSCGSQSTAVASSPNSLSTLSSFSMSIPTTPTSPLSTTTSSGSGDAEDRPKRNRDADDYSQPTKKSKISTPVIESQKVETQNDSTSTNSSFPSGSVRLYSINEWFSDLPTNDDAERITEPCDEFNSFC
eukprot:TRINITY_DN6996_c0_g1_i1.p1 TRINITY_DN6996_c0_g1~~TRINITY_DN6996_c0_g1_i1.p1  ORF type:complete len:418 (-),score=52.93 TRINITY_DN6996_c0_g1_i1:27-1280(-)